MPRPSGPAVHGKNCLLPKRGDRGVHGHGNIAGVLQGAGTACPCRAILQPLYGVSMGGRFCCFGSPTPQHLNQPSVHSQCPCKAARGRTELGEGLTADMVSSLSRTPGSGLRKSSETLHAQASSPVTGPSRSMPETSGVWNHLPQKSPHPTSPGIDASTEGRRDGFSAQEPSPAFHQQPDGLCSAETRPFPQGAGKMLRSPD